MENLEGFIREIAELVKSSSGPQMVPGGNVPYVLVPEGCTAKALPELVYNEHAEKPERIRAFVGVLDPASFIEYYNLFSDENSRVFADESKLTVVSVLDYHGAKVGAPRWGHHRVTLTLKTSEEWKTWLTHNKKVFDQTEFAEFLEQNSMDISKPSPASIREVADSLQATTEVEFNSGVRQQDGQVKFKYTETTKATVGAGQVEVPDRFTISIPAFVGAEDLPIEALLRYRVKEGHLTFFFVLVRPEEVLRTAFISARDVIAKELGVKIINGTPNP